MTSFNQTRFDELLAKSQKLNTQLGIDTAGITQPLRRGLHELESSKHIGAAAGRRLDEQEELNAVRLLAQNNFDAVGLAVDVKDILVETKYDSASEKLDSTDLDGYLAHHHDMIILTAIDEARKCSEERVRNTQRKWLADDWASSRKHFLQSLGHTTQQWSGNMASSHASSGSTLKAFPPATPATATPFSLTQYTPATSHTPKITADPISTQDVSAGVGSLLGKHAKVIRQLALETQKPSTLDSARHQGSASGRSSGGIKVCMEMSAQVKSALTSDDRDSAGLSVPDLVGYKAALDLLSEMTGEAKSEKKAPGYFSPVCFTADSVNPTLLAHKQQELSLRSKISLEKQQWTMWSNEIDECAARGHLDVLVDTDGSGRAQRLKAYVAYLWRVGSLFYDVSSNIAMSSVGSGGGAGEANMPIWAYVYYSLAIGDVHGALAELDKCVSLGIRCVEPAALKAMRILAQLLAAQSAQDPVDTSGYDTSGYGRAVSQSSSYTLSASDRASLADAMRACSELYAQEVDEPEGRMDPYKALVLSLLSLNTKEMLVDPGVPGYTMQNYLWGCMWFATTQRLISQSPGGASLPPSYALPDHAGETQLFADVLEFGGAEYFDPRQENPFKYATVLLTCQRFGDALAYLWSSGKTLPAIHLGMVCLHYGLILPHVPLAHNPTFPSAAKFAKNVQDIGDSLTPARMLQNYFSQQFQLAYPEVSVDYFIGLNTNWLANVKGIDAQTLEVHSLRSQNSLFEVFQEFLTAMGAPQVTALVGDIPGEGPVTKGHLVNYLDKDQIGSLLSRSAFHLLTVRREASAAVHFFKLCGRFAEALEELCGQLSLVATVASSPDRAYWTNTCAEFFNRYVRPGAGPLHQSLGKEGKVELVGTFQQLLNAALFVTLCGEGRWADALNAVDDASLLPRTESEVVAATQAISGLGANALVLRVIDDVIMYVMDCLERLYYAIRESLERGGSLAPGAVGGMLQPTELNDHTVQLQAVVERAKSVAAFTNVIGPRVLKPETISRVARIQVGIM
jgi:hypothetical protein